jgi:hypothetical protein
MNANLHDYTEDNPPYIMLNNPILHPTNHQKAIGHTGLDTARNVGVATFPRKRSKHWFRGESSDGLTGYGISESVLDGISEKCSRVLIIETDHGRVIEYDITDFEDATIAAFSPALEECVIGDETMRVDDDLYNDRQRVLPMSKARMIFARSEVTISQ